MENATISPEISANDYATTHSLASNLPNQRRVLIADDHHLILDALRTMISGQYEVMVVDNSSAFLEALSTFQPDIGVLDINMPGEDGFITARKALEASPSLPIVFLSMYSDSKYVEKAAQVGAKAYLSKTTPAQELIEALNSVLEGEVLLAPSAATASSVNGDLTARQREVLHLIAQGSSAKDIANQLNISVRTAEFHRAAIMQRLNLHSTAQMTRYAITNDIA